VWIIYPNGFAQPLSAIFDPASSAADVVGSSISEGGLFDKQKDSIVDLNICCDPYEKKHKLGLLLKRVAVSGNNKIR
jgi:hypothetical protein